MKWGKMPYCRFCDAEVEVYLKDGKRRCKTCRLKIDDFED